MATTYKIMKTFTRPDGDNYVQYEIVDGNGRKMIAPNWYEHEDDAFTAGQHIEKDGVLYRFTSAHTAEAAWDSSEVTAVSVTGEIESVKSDVNGKASKVSGGTTGNFVSLDANGNIQDSGHKHSDYLTEHQDISGKANKVSGGTANNFAALDENGDLKDSGSKASDFLTEHQDISGKADKVSGATNGHFAGLDGNGDLTDSGKSASDFVASADFYATEMPVSESDSTKVATALSGLKSAIQQKADLIHDTVSNVAIASVPDGAANLPLSALQIAVEPVQDLHGFDAPWPGGASINVFSPEQYGKWTSSDGTVSDQTYGCIGVHSPAIPSTSYTAKIYGTRPYSMSIIEYDANDNFLARTHITFSGTEYDSIAVTTNASTAKISLQVAKQNGTITADDVASYKAFLGKTADLPVSYVPYANICPISGWTGCNVARTGKNLCDSAVGRYSWSNGVRYNNTTGLYCAVESKVKIKGGSDCVISFENTATTQTVYVGWLNGDTFIKQDSKSATPYSFTAPDNATHCTITIRNAADYTGDPTVSNLQIEFGSIASAYSAYSGHTYPISWQTEAGTVYGGTIDPVNGVLTVEGVYRLLSDKTLWYTDGNYISYRYDFSDRKLFSNSFTGLLCSALPADESKPSYIRWRGASQVRISTVGVTIEVLQGLSENNQIGIYYPLATPVTIPLTAVEIATVQGQNNLWADCGNILLMEYPCDTKLYVDKKITETVALILENT